MLELIGNIFGAIKEFFGFQSKKLDLKNKEEIKKAKLNKVEQERIDRTNKEISDKKLNEIRKKLGN
jgi:hypothetical protein